MIQARIPEAILRELPVGTETAPLLEAIRAGAHKESPESLRSWLRRNRFDEGEEVELLPKVVPIPAEVLIKRVGRAGKRRLTRVGVALIILALIIQSATIIWAEVLFSDSTAANLPNRGLLSTVSGIGSAWLLTLALPLCALLIAACLLIMVWIIPVPFVSALLLGISGLWLFLPAHALPAGLTVGGFAFIARARGRSPWLGFLGIFSLCVRDQNRL